MIFFSLSLKLETKNENSGQRSLILTQKQSCKPLLSKTAESLLSVGMQQKEHS